MENKKVSFLNKIKNNIEIYGHHITFVHSHTEPNFAYTIGVSENLKFELIFAGGVFYLQDEIMDIINNIVIILKTQQEIRKFEIYKYGTFTISPVDQSWIEIMMLGCFEYYNTNEIIAFQIVPDTLHITLDVPNMSEKYDITSQPIWQWLVKKWDIPVPKTSQVITNIESLKGKKITEVTRWEKDEWEAFSGNGPDINKKDIRVVSIGTLLNIDSSLEPILSLETGKGIWRNSDEMVWNKWN